MKTIVRSIAAIVALLLAAVLSVMVTTHGQGSILGGIMSYSPQNQWIIVTDQTGTWHAPLALTNSAAPSNSVVEFTVNTDDQFVIQTYGGGNPDSFLDLDTDGSANMYGSGGGGVGVEAATGDTCLPSVRNAPCSASALRIGANGLLKQYIGRPTAGNGISAILYSADATLSGSFGPYTIFTTNSSGYASSGMYRLTGYMTVVGAYNGSTMQFATDYTDESGLQAQTTGLPVSFQGVGDKLPFSFAFFSESGKPITISAIVSGGNPTYMIHLRLEAL
ncbi:MAG TPA: hypothetical protein VMM16_12090 [Verrucomicrobiae bacterium]|nr:hypothetical protein [Verrucomicrobiae bacterium]